MGREELAFMDTEIVFIFFMDTEIAELMHEYCPQRCKWKWQE